jgi:LysM repeat protein
MINRIHHRPGNIPVYISHFIIILLASLLLFNHSSLAQGGATPEVIRQYIEKYKDIAIREMMIYKIPASITLAQGIHESGAGRSKLAVEANNHFGIKCHKEWTGKTFIQDDEKKNECFRKYDDPLDSYRDHSLFLSQRDRYKPLFNLPVTDYKAWAKGLKEAGYATNPKYPDILIKTIEDFQLYIYDSKEYPVNFRQKGISYKDSARIAERINEFPLSGIGPQHRAVFVNNGLKLILAGAGDDISKISKDMEIPVNQLLHFNDLSKGNAVVPGQIIYLETKKNKGSEKYHLVAKGDEMYELSQLYGIKLTKLYSKNKMTPGTQPLPGKKLRLR